ncbi:MAG: hypothetical protein JOZ07_19835 [Solirubrobacterales bacterium]|nr:hypothetical protein [Solirubrobacterales bacterium]
MTEPLTIEALERWVLFGARWRVVEVSGDAAVVDLCACTGELVERHRVSEPEVVAYLRDHRAQPSD